MTVCCHCLYRGKVLQSACLSVCMSVHKHISKKNCYIFVAFVIGFNHSQVDWNEWWELQRWLKLRPTVHFLVQVIMHNRPRDGVKAQPNVHQLFPLAIMTQQLHRHDNDVFQLADVDRRYVIMWNVEPQTGTAFLIRQATQPRVSHTAAGCLFCISLQ